MRIEKLKFVVATAVILAAPGAMAASSTERSAIMATGAVTSQPIGHYQFCLTHASECDVATAKPLRVHLTIESWNELVAVNGKVNEEIAPATDLDVYGVEEWWTYPTTEGDCEDLALLKRRDLIEKGWPVSALLITVVKRPDGEGHAVLTVATDRGDLVLDNLDGRVLVWSQTPYTFVKRQSQFNTGQWIAIDDTRAPVVTSSP